MAGFPFMSLISLHTISYFRGAPVRCSFCYIYYWVFHSFDATLSEFALISFSDCSWLVYRNTIDFCALIVYSATLPNLFSHFFSGFIKFSMYKICRLWKRDSSTSYLVWILFCSAFVRLLCLEHPTRCWIDVARSDTLVSFLPSEKCSACHQ